MENIRKIIFTCLLILIGCQIQAQITFYKTYIGSAFDRGEGIVQLSDSSYAVTGGSGAFSVNSGQAYLMLVDSVGNHLWTKSYGGNGSDWGRRVFYKPGVGYMIAGTSNSTSEGEYNFYVIATDEGGNLIQENNFGTNNWEQLWDAVLLDDGGMFMVGETEGETTNQKDMYIARVDDLGDTLWTQTISSGADDVANAVDVLNDTTVIIGGYSWDGSQSNGVLISMHINGSENWRTFYGSPASAKINTIEVYNNEIYAGGEIVQQGEDQSDLFLLKTDSDGNQLGSNTFYYNSNDWVTDFAIVDDTSLYISWSSESSDLNVYPYGYDAFVSRFNISLYIENFSQSFSGYNDDNINELIVANDGGTTLIGTCGRLRLDPTEATSIMIAKIGPGDETTVNAINDIDIVSYAEEGSQSKFNIFPNPSSGELNIVGVDQKIDVEIYAMTGELVLSEKESSKIDISKLESGVYLLHLIDGDHRSLHRIVKR